MRPTGLHFACVECVMGVWESVKRQNKMFSTAFCLVCLREPELPVGQMGTSVSASASVLSSHQHWLYRLMAMPSFARGLGTRLRSSHPHQDTAPQPMHFYSFALSV